MKIIGRVSDAVNETPIQGAKVILLVGKIELATLYTSREGRFELEQNLSKFSGQNLTCKIAKKGFIAADADFRIEENDIKIDMELMPEKDIVAPPPKPKPPEPSPKPKFNKTWLIVAGIAAVVAIGFVIYKMVENPPHKPPSPPPFKFEGTWRNEDQEVPEALGEYAWPATLKIKKTGSGFELHVWGKCIPRNCNWGTEVGTMEGNSIQATWDVQRPVVRSVSLKIEPNGNKLKVLENVKLPNGTIERKPHTFIRE